MSWIRLDCSTLDDEFTVALTGDEFKAWCMFLLRVKAQGSRGSVPTTSTNILSRCWSVPESAVRSMLKKSGDRITTEGGRWIVRNWSKFQEDHKGKTAKGENSPDALDGTTLPHSTLHDSTDKDIMNEQLELIVERWNETAKTVGLSMVDTLNDRRKSGIRKRLSETGFDFDRILEGIKSSSFLCGSTGWKVTFDWIFTSPNNYVKVLEGQYKDGSNGTGRNAGSQHARATFKHDDASIQRLKDLQATLEQRDRERNERSGAN